MAHFSTLRRFVSLTSLLGLGGIALLGGACANTTPSDEDHLGAADSHLTAEQCMYFDVNGKDTICHHTGSAKHPYTIIKTSEQACINGHAGHDGDYIAVGDPTCQGGGCLPEGAPCDATLPCCDGLTCTDGTCVAPPASTCPCDADAFWVQSLGDLHFCAFDEEGVFYGFTTEDWIRVSDTFCQGGGMFDVTPAERDVCVAEIQNACPGPV